MLARAARLSVAARKVLDAAAVIGPRIEVDVLSEVADASADAIDECIAGGLLHSEADGLAFRHELARLAIEGAMSSSRRINIHRRVLHVLEASVHSESDFARLAHHAEGGGDRDAVLGFAPQAGQRAAELGAHREAAAQYARALRFAGSLPAEDRAVLLEARSYECYLTDQLEEALQARRQAMECWKSVGNKLKEGDSLRWLSRLLWFLVRNREAERAAESAIEILEQAQPGRELAMAYSNRAHLLMLAGDSEGARAWGERAISLAEELDEPEIMSHALNNVGASEWHKEMEAGRAKLERSLELAKQHSLEEHVARALTNLSSVSVSHRHYEIAERYFAEGIDYCIERDLDSWRLYMLGWKARMLFEQACWDDALAVADAVLRHPRVAPISLINALVVRGRVGARRGEDRADSPLEEALKLAVETTELQRLAPVACARAEMAWLSSDVETTAREAGDAFALARTRGNAWELGELAYWMWLGKGIEKAPPGAAEPFALEISGDYRAASRIWTDIGCPYEAAMALARGDQDELKAALAVFQGLRARPAASLVAGKLKTMGVGRIPRGPRTATAAHPAGLTSREGEVLDLMAEGLRNADIANRLFISPKTVDHHVSAILRKLGVSTRAEALAEGRRLGIVQYRGWATPT